MSATPDAVEKVITEFLQRLQKMPDSLAPELTLYADGIGLDSLETAELSSVLEDEFGDDPFATGDLPQTVGDILGFYAVAADA